MKKKHCKILSASYLNETVDKLCMVDIVFNYETEKTGRQMCHPRKLSNYWRVRGTFFDTPSLMLSLTSAEVTKIQEVNSLLSDVGGNMGLFLGISLFSVWLDFPVLLKRFLIGLNNTAEYTNA